MTFQSHKKLLFISLALVTVEACSTVTLTAQREGKSNNVMQSENVRAAVSYSVAYDPMGFEWKINDRRWIIRKFHLNTTSIDSQVMLLNPAEDSSIYTALRRFRLVISSK